MRTEIIFSKTKLCGDEQWNGGVLRDVALVIDSGALRVQREHDFFRLCEA